MQSSTNSVKELVNNSPEGCWHRKNAWLRNTAKNSKGLSRPWRVRRRDLGCKCNCLYCGRPKGCHWLDVMVAAALTAREAELGTRWHRHCRERPVGGHDGAEADAHQAGTRVEDREISRHPGWMFTIRVCTRRFPWLTNPSPSAPTRSRGRLVPPSLKPSVLGAAAGIAADARASRLRVAVDEVRRGQARASEFVALRHPVQVFEEAVAPASSELWCVNKTAIMGCCGKMTHEEGKLR